MIDNETAMNGKSKIHLKPVTLAGDKTRTKCGIQTVLVI